MSDSCDPMACRLSGSSVHRILQARILEWVAISFSRGSSWPRNWTRVSCIAGRWFTNWITALQEMGIPGHLICLLRNLYAGQEATVRTGHGTTDWFQIGKGGLSDTRQLSRATPARSSAWYSPAEPRDNCRLICLILASWVAPHLPAHLFDTRQRSRVTPARSSDWYSPAEPRDTYLLIFLILAFTVIAFSVFSKKLFSTPKSVRYSPVFSSKRFIITAFTFRSVIHFELYYELICAGRKRLNFIFFLIMKIRLF